MANQSFSKTRYFLCVDNKFIGVYCGFESREQGFIRWEETEIDWEIYNFVLKLCDPALIRDHGGAFKR